MIRELLRDRTQDSHQRLENLLDLMAIPDLHSYAHVVVKFYGFVRPLEEKLMQAWSTAPVFQDPRIAFRERQKTQYLEADLNFLKSKLPAWVEPSQMSSATNLPRLDSPAHVLGCLYVMEGSTLGGQVLTRHFEKALSLSERSGVAYFSGYGAETGKKWREFISFLEEKAQAHPDWSDQIIASAIETFEKLETWFK